MFLMYSFVIIVDSLDLGGATSVSGDSSDNYCFSEPVQCISQENENSSKNNIHVRSQTSLAGPDSLYSPAPTRPASVAATSALHSHPAGFHKVEPLTKPPPYFLRPKQQPQSQHHMYQGKKQQHKSHISIFQ